MKLGLLGFIGILVVSFSASAQQKDDPKCKDHPLFTRMPTYWIHHCKEQEFEARQFADQHGNLQTVEGHSWDIYYYPQSTATVKPSELQILKNYENAVVSQGGRIVFQTKGKEVLLLQKADKEFWVEVRAEFTGKYSLSIVERTGMKQDVTANADVFADQLKMTGHSAVYGILFDTGKSDIKPESAAAIAEIGKLLKADGTLTLYVVGHTDNVGGLEGNMRLSQSRADAVVKALTAGQGIAPSRLKPFGAGPYAPVASNDSDEGKAKNRRVELVKQ